MIALELSQEELVDMIKTADRLRKSDMGRASAYVDKLLAHIEFQAQQIEALKAGWKDDRANYLASELPPYEMTPENETRYWKDRAYQQLTV